MKNKNPVSIIIIGAVLFVIANFIPNGIRFSNIVEVIAIINFVTTVFEGLGLGLAIAGIALLIKNRKK